MTIKLFATQIAHGFSPEARVFASLLERRSPDLDVRVVMQIDPDISKTDAFSREAHCDLVLLDTGWRPNAAGGRKGLLDKGKFGARFLLARGKIARLAAEYKPAVVYSCQQHYDLLAASFAADKLRVPQVIHLHYTVGPWLKQHALSRLLSCDHVVCVSDFIRQEALRHGIAPERATTMSLPPLPDGSAFLSTRRELGVPEGAFVFGNVSRLEPEKGHGEILQAFGQIADQRRDAWLVIVGAGSLENELRRQAGASRWGERIVFTGRRENVPQLLGGMDAFVHPLFYEPFCMAILEAMAAALPVVAFEQGGPAEIIVNGETGYLTPPGDVDQLADALAALHDSPQLAGRFGKAGRARVANEFRPEVASRKFEKVLMQVAK